MEKSNLYLVFSALNKTEIRQFGDFVRSPFFNKRQSLIDLFDYLSATNTKSKKIRSKEAAFAKIFPQKAYDDQKMRLMMSDLLKLLEQFFIHQSSNKDEIQCQMQLAESFRERKLHKHYSRVLRNIKKKQNDSPYRDAEYFFKNYQLQWSEYQFQSSVQRIREFNLQEISDTVDIAFIALKLRQTCYSLSHQAVYKTEYEFGFIDELLSYIEKRDLLAIPAISVYYYCYYTIKSSENESYFLKFRSLISEYHSLFPHSEIRDLFLFAINYYIKRLNTGDKSYFRDGLALYKEGLAMKILMENNILSRFTYNNIVAMGLRIGEYQWTSNFIHQYKDALEKEHREQTFSFNLGRLEYEKKNYSKALQLLQKAEYKDLLNNLIIKTLQIKMYYELSEFDLLQSHLDAMQNYIRRNKVIMYHRKNSLNIIHYVRKLLTLNPYNKSAQQLLKQEVEQEEILTERDWILQQID